MTTKPDIKRGRGRPTVDPDTELVSSSLRLTRLDWETFKSLGGAKWLREFLRQHRAKHERAKSRDE